MVNNILGENIKVFILQHFKTQKEFAQFIDVREETVGKIIKRGTLNKATIDNIVNKYPNLNLNWLFYNKGEMWLKEEKKEVKTYPIDTLPPNVTRESEVFYDTRETFLIRIEDYVDHLKTEVAVLENLIKKKIDRKDKNPMEKYIKLLKKDGFKDVTTAVEKKRSSKLFDFTKGDFTITLDGDNCKLLESGTGIKQLPLSEANIRNMIAYVAEQTNDIQK